MRKNPYRDAWEEMGDAVFKSPGRFIILVIYQWFNYFKNKLFGGIK